MTEQEQLDFIVDDVLSAREAALSAKEKFLVELLDIVLLAAAERLVEAEANEAGMAGIFLGGADSAGSSAKAGRKLRRRSAH
jgi:DNA gyrase/topoisomerase IV subunit B